MGVKLGLSGYVKTNGRGSADTRTGILPLPCCGFLCQVRREKLKDTPLGQFNWNNPCTWMMEEIPVCETLCVWAKSKNENVQCMYRIYSMPCSVPYTATHCRHVPFMPAQFHTPLHIVDMSHSCLLSSIHRYILRACPIHACSVPYTATHCGHVPFMPVQSHTPLHTVDMSHSCLLSSIHRYTL